MTLLHFTSKLNSTQPCNFDNITHSSPENPTLCFICYQILLPIFTINGIVGNFLNLLVFSGQHLRRSLGKREENTNVGLVALAVSDMMLCFFVFPTTFNYPGASYKSKSFLLYYLRFNRVPINTFMMASTWLTVGLATERYIAICFPFKARKYLSLNRTKLAVAYIFLFSCLFNIPYLWKTEVEPICFDDEENSIRYTVKERLFNGYYGEHVLRIFWVLLGNFIPLMLLLFFNIQLIISIQRSYKERNRLATLTWSKSIMRINNSTGKLETNISTPERSNSNASTSTLKNGDQLAGCKSYMRRQQETSYRITITLISIVVLFLVLVAPSETLKHILSLVVSAEELSNNVNYVNGEVVTNTMQIVNFSVNFILYVCFLRTFRCSVRRLFSSLCCRDNVRPKSKSQRVARVKKLLRKELEESNLGSNSQNPILNPKSQTFLSDSYTMKTISNLQETVDSCACMSHVAQSDFNNLHQTDCIPLNYIENNVQNEDEESSHQ